MDEDDGRPGARARQFGSTDALLDASASSLRVVSVHGSEFLVLSSPLLRHPSHFFSVGWFATTLPQGLKPILFCNGYGTTKVVPFQNSFQLNEAHGAAEAYGTTEVVLLQDGFKPTPYPVLAPS
ncbi:MAG TPA: hypothetical protein VE291_04295 [Terracidiphilus sp.]|jgi:hypothetical protein|nr:hypothetical protein [Terracidiphilus sp.]